MTIPIASAGHLPSATSVDEAKFTSSSYIVMLIGKYLEIRPKL
jgi:hypothetical protein